MLWWNQKFLSQTLAVMLFASVCQFCSECAAQNSKQHVNNGDSYYSRPDLRTPTSPSFQSRSTERPESLSQGTVVNQRYQEMLDKNRSRVQSLTRDYTYPGSYQIEQPQPNYARNSLPERLVPPGRSRSTSTERPIRQRASGELLQKATESQNPDSYLPNRAPQSSNPAPELPPIVKPEDVSWMIERPVYFSNEVHVNPIADNRKRNQHVSQGAPSNVITGTSKIPAGYSHENSTVTRARILITQQGGDPFGEAPGDQNQDSKRTQEDPFADPPSDLDPQNQRDPFADPPTDLDPQQSPRDPFGERPNPIQHVDPFPNTPQDIVPPTEFDPPVQPSQPNQTDPTPDSDTTPDTDPIQQQNTTEPELILGPFKSNGFSPRPIQPAPPRREFEYLVPQVSPVINDSYPTNQYDQPSFLGPEFSKSELYEGIIQPSTGYPTRFADSQVARPRLIDRYCRNSGCCVTGCDGYECQGESYFDEFGCQFDCGFEPMFYLSIFGGYTQLEDSGPFTQSPFIFAPDFSQDTLSYNDGFGLGISVGQIQGANLRTELEFTFRDNNTDSLFRNFNTFPDSTTGVDGSVETFSGMLNVVWDFCPSPIFQQFRPYVGGGIGFSFLDINIAAGNNIFPGNQTDGTQSSFAYQLMAGLTRPVSARMDGFIEYRYFKTDSVPINLGTLIGDVDYETDNIFFGVRMHF